MIGMYGAGNKEDHEQAEGSPRAFLSGLGWHISELNILFDCEHELVAG